MINSITLKFGKAPNATAEQVQTTPITVFVGPNNSGKSKVLTEINAFCTTGQIDESRVILDNIEFEGLSAEEANSKIQSITLHPRASETIHANHVIVGKRGKRFQVPTEGLQNALQDPNSHTNQFCVWYLQLNTLILNGANRIGLVSQQNGGDLQQSPENSFQVLFSDNDKREEMRRIVFDAFGTYPVIDPTALGNLRLRLSARPPSTEAEERGLHSESVEFHGASLLIDTASDGVKAFTGIITEIIAGDPHVLLIDEPEAFLHPSLSFKLGKEIARTSHGTDKRLFVSTHSPNFVMGCIQSGAPINIIRLTYREGVPTARLLPNEEILRLMRNPLLRSTGVLGGLFYEFVVVTESDADRAFYQEINDRLVTHDSARGIPNCLFLNAQNKQTERMIIGPLRDLGIPAAGVVDIDVIKNGGADWTQYLASGFLPEIERQSLANLRISVKQKFDSSGHEMKRDGGIDILSHSDKEAANNLFDKLADYGLFVVRRGELESWLPNLNSTGHGPNWLVSIFETMGEDPNSASYLKPSPGDVWDFLGGIKAWLMNPNRKGIPR